MSQNTSSAVMQQRKEPSDSFDYFPTPLWATRALCEWLKVRSFIRPDMTVSEPACGEGHMARALSEYFGAVEASDIQDMGYGKQQDYLFMPQEKVDWTITNPPFRLAQEFIAQASKSSRYGIAMIVRAAFLESVGRYNELWTKNPPSFVLQFSERVPMFKGRVDPKGSSATSYCWIVWIDGEDSTQLDWIAPCRKRLEKEGDYA